MIVCGSRTSYARRCRFYLNDTVEADIEFYNAPEGAKFFYGITPFWPANNWYDKPNLPWIIGEDTSKKIKYRKGQPRYPDLAGDHFEGSLEDMAGKSYRPGGIYRPYDPPPTAPACDFRPALGFLGGNVEQKANGFKKARLGFLGGEVQICPPRTGILGLRGGMCYSIPVDGVYILTGGSTDVPPVLGRLGFLGGAFCGDDPHVRCYGTLAQSLGSLSLIARGSVHAADLAGTLAGTLAAGLTLAGVGTIAGPGSLFTSGYLAHSFDMGLSLTGVGASTSPLPPGDYAGELHANLDAGLTLASEGEAVAPPPPEFAGTLHANLDAGITLASEGEYVPADIGGTLAANLDAGITLTGFGEAGGPPSPIEISGLAGYYISDALTFTDETFVVAATSEDDPVGGWRCSLGVGPDLEWFNGTAVLKTNIQNGYPAVRFDSNTGFRGDLFWAAAAPYTIFIVYSDRNGSAYSGRAIQGGSGVNYIIGPYGGTYAEYAAGFVCLYGATVSGTVVTQVATDDNASIQKAYFNGGQVGSGGGSQGYNPRNIRLGNCTGDGYPEHLIGDIFCLVYFDRWLSDPEREAIEDYLRTKYAHY